MSLYMITLTAMHVRHSRVSGSENSNQQDKGGTGAAPRQQRHNSGFAKAQMSSGKEKESKEVKSGGRWYKDLFHLKPI